MNIWFLGVLHACLHKENDGDSGKMVDTGIPITCDTSTTMCSVSESTFTVDQSTIDAYLVDGNFTEESCTNICTDQLGWADDYCGCALQGTAPSIDITCTYTMCAVEGRSHGNIQKLQRIPTNFAELYAQAFHAEASSVMAFILLRLELENLGKNQYAIDTNILERCTQASKDEIVHARYFAGLAKQQGCTLPPLQFGDMDAIQNHKRSLLEITIDNAVEGCIFESFSAIKASYQAKHSTNPTFAKIAKAIAEEETQHAILAWDIHTMLMAQLSHTEQRIVKEAQHAAILQLRAQIQREQQIMPLEFQRALGYPTNTVIQEFCQQIQCYIEQDIAKIA